MRRPFIWIFGGRWDRTAAAIRILLAVAVALGVLTVRDVTRGNSTLRIEVGELRAGHRTDSDRISQLEQALRSNNIPIPEPPPTTTPRRSRPRPATTAPRQRPTTTRPAPGTTKPTTITTALTCPTPTVPVNGMCIIPDPPNVP